MKDVPQRVLGAVITPYAVDAFDLGGELQVKEEDDHTKNTFAEVKHYGHPGGVCKCTAHYLGRKENDEPRQEDKKSDRQQDSEDRRQRNHYVIVLGKI